LIASCYKIVDSFNHVMLKESGVGNFVKAGVRNFGEVGVGVGHFASDSATLILTDMLRPDHIDEAKLNLISLCSPRHRVIR